MATEWTPERRAKFAADMAARRAAKKPQTNTTKETVAPQPTQPVQEVQDVPKEAPKQESVATPQGNVNFTPEQFQQLLAALSQGRSDNQGGGFGGSVQTNSQGQVVGTQEKFNIDPSYYPNPVEDLVDWAEKHKVIRRFAFSENYYLKFDIQTKPYETKDHLFVREPTFDVTLYQTLYDEEGEDTGKFIVCQAFHFNEDEQTAIEIASNLGYNANHDNMREIMNQARMERIKRWLTGYFIPERNYDLATSFNEISVDGRIQKVITKSNVQGGATPNISLDELRS